MTDVRGWVYVMSNEAMPGLVKVGFSTKDPNIRAGELGGTGVPYPHVVEYDALVNAPREVEQRIHQALEACRVDVSTDTPVGKEWFRCSIHVAVVTLRRLTEGTRITEFVRDTSITEREDSATPYAKAAEARQALAKRGGSWTLSEGSLLLAHKTTGRCFKPDEYRYEGDTAIKGFAVKSREVSWVWLEDVEFIG